MKTTNLRQRNDLNSSRHIISLKMNAEEVEQAKKLAKKIMQTYDKNRKGIIQRKEIIKMIMDGYKPLDTCHQPSETEIQSYMNVLDKDGDGKITLTDLEDTCIRYLTQKYDY